MAPTKASLQPPEGHHLSSPHHPPGLVGSGTVPIRVAAYGAGGLSSAPPSSPSPAPFCRYRRRGAPADRIPFGRPEGCSRPGFSPTPPRRCYTPGWPELPRQLLLLVAARCRGLVLGEDLAQLVIGVPAGHDREVWQRRHRAHVPLPAPRAPSRDLLKRRSRDGDTWASALTVSCESASAPVWPSPAAVGSCTAPPARARPRSWDLSGA